MASIKNLIAIDIILSHTGVKDTLKGVQDSFNSAMSVISDASAKADSGFTRTADNLIKTGGVISSTGGILTTFITGPLVGLGTMAVNASREFESAFAGVKKTVDETANTSFKDLSDGIRQMATEIPAAVTEIAAVAEAAGQLGISADDVLEFTEVMVNLGVSTNMSAEQAATALARIANVMGNTADEYERMGSTIVYLGNNFATTETEIANMSTRISTAASNLNMTTAEVMGLAAGLTSIGITAEAGGTAISKFLSSMAFASDVGNKNLKELEQQTGLTGREMELMSSNNSKGFKELASELGMTTTEMNKVIKAGKDLNTMSEISGMEAEEFAKIVREEPVEAFLMFIDGLANAQDAMMENGEASESLISLLNELGVSEVRMTALLKGSASAHDLIREAIYGANGAWEDNTALTKEAAARYETFDSQIQLMKNSWKDVMIAIGDQLVPYLKTLNEWLKGLADNLRNMKPEDFKRIVDLLIKVAAVGPTLMVTGKAISAIGTGMKLFKGVQGLLGGVLDGSNKLNNAYRGGGWVKSLVDSLGLVVNKAGAVTTATGKLVSPDSMKHLANLGDGAEAVATKMAMAKVPTGAFAQLLSGDLSGAIHAVKSTGTKLMTSPVFKAVGWAGVATYAYDVAKEFIDLGFVSDGLKNIFKSFTGAVGSVAGALGKLPSTLSGGALGWGDMAVAAGGALSIFAGLSNPIGWVTLGLVGLKGAIGLYKSAQEEANAQAILFQGAIDGSNEKLSNYQTSMDKFSQESLPILKEQYDNLTSNNKMSDLFPESSQFATSRAEIEGYLDGVMGAVISSHQITKDSFIAYYDMLGESDSLYAQQLLESGEKNYETTRDTVSRRTELIMELLEKYDGDVSKFNEEERISYQEHLNALNKIAVETLTPELAREAAQMERHWAGVKETHERLTTEQRQSTANIIRAGIDSDYSILAAGHKAEMDLLEQKILNEGIAEEKANTLRDEAQTRFQAKEIEMYQKHINDYLVKTKGFTMDQLAEYDKLKKELAGKQGEISDAEEAVRLNRATADQKALLKKKETFDAEYKDLKELINMSTEEQADYIKFLEETMPAGMAKVWGLVDGKLDTSFSTILKNVSTLTTDMNKTLEDSKVDFLRTGGFMARGLGEGWSGYDSVLQRKAQQTVRLMEQAANKEAGIKSPSRLFMKMGSFMTEGLAIGFEDNEDLLTKSAQGVVQQLADLAELESSFSFDVKSSVGKIVNVDATSTLRTAISEAVVSAFNEIGPIVTYFTEETAEEAVNSVLRTQTSGPYGG